MSVKHNIFKKYLCTFRELIYFDNFQTDKNFHALKGKILISLLALVGGRRGLGDGLGLEGPRCVSLRAERKKLGYTVLKFSKVSVSTTTCNS